MNATPSGRLIILSGPSCVGKSPLKKALRKFYPHLTSQLKTLVLFNSRAPRPGELDGVDYHFRTRSQIGALKADTRYAVLEVRGDMQALDLDELKSLLHQHDAFFEGNPLVGRLLLTHPLLGDVRRLSIFLSPLSKDEIAYLTAPERGLALPEFVTDVMRRKLLRRVRHQKGEPSLLDLEDIETRASSAHAEMKEAWHFDHVIPNHDGEDSDNWEAFYYPIGDARKAVDSVAAIIEGAAPSVAEKWGQELL
jgi:guanylate kinase